MTVNEHNVITKKKTEAQEEEEENNSSDKKEVVGNLKSFDPWTLAHEISSIKASSATKASPLMLKSWIGMVLTLDGRDKATKLIQYTCRILAHYCEVIASNIAFLTVGNEVAAAYFFAKAKKFRNLQKSLTNSRKAFRLGRSIIEIDKLKSVGFLHWISWYLRQMMFHPLHSQSLTEESEIKDSKSDCDDDLLSREGKDISWHPNTKVETKDKDISKTSDKQTHSGSVPRMRLPRKVSSNLGPALIIKPEEGEALTGLRQMSSIGRIAYMSLTSCIDKSRTNADAPPMWKIISSVCKLLGLAGFWTGDNISYLYSSGFFEDSGKKGRAKSASIFAARSYFFSAVSGLYLNFRQWISHRNGPLREALEEISKYKSKTIVENRENVAYEEHKRDDELGRLKDVLDSAKRKNAALSIALLKSCCDVAVFSNNTGIDLHLKYRGRKMNEGIHCVCGITSALTVLYNNFPAAKV